MTVRQSQQSGEVMPATGLSLADSVPLMRPVRHAAHRSIEHGTNAVAAACLTSAALAAASSPLLLTQ